MPLVIYKSSAGSGKTTTLVNEYLKITLKNPSEFRHVLAITFTNKAANEMKERILSALDEFVDGRAWHKGEYSNLIAELKMDADELKTRAVSLQYLVLHHYDEFSVSTIDAFVHKIIRTFANDVKLPQNFEVVIDTDDIVPDIVNELFAKVGVEKALTDIMVQFVMTQTDDEKNYDLGREINNFTLKQMGEDGFNYLQKLERFDAGQMLEIITGLFDGLKKQKRTIIAEADKALALIASQGLGGNEFNGGQRGIGGFFLKAKTFDDKKPLTSSATQETTVNEDKWYAKNKPDHIKSSIDQIKNDLTICYHKIKKEYQHYYYLKLLSQKIYAMALANEIRKIFNDYTERTQKVHISEFNKRISEEIAGQPIPFIYERLGRRYKYFLVDEFQDTSILQWHNLLPLIDESLSNGNFNMLVGDAKQAIYRFRNGEVELFVNLPKIYQNDGSLVQLEREKLLENSHIIKVIEENYRSREEIIKFNNNFFGVLKNGFGERMAKIYEQHEQTVPDKNGKNEGGYVSVEFIESENAEDYSEKRLEKIKSYVEHLLALGFDQKDICVLTRTNSNSSEVASCLLESGFKVVSPESLLLSNSPAVRFIASLIKLIADPGNQVVLAEVLRSHAVFTNIDNNLDGFFSKGILAAGIGLENLFTYLELSIKPDDLMYYPVFEIAEALVRELNPTNIPDVYLQYFLDFVFAAHSTGKITPAEFVELWEDKKEKAYITLPEGEDAINVMTVHKAKGLKFNVVIADIIDRRNLTGKSELWTDVDLPELKELKVGLLPISKNLEIAGLEPYYEEEKEKTKLDFMNMVYVAFTRPVDALFLLGDKNTSGRKESFSDLLVEFLTKTSGYEETRQHYEFGSLLNKIKNDYKEEDEVLVLNKMASAAWWDKVTVSHADEVYWEALDSKPARAYGKLIHNILSGIKTSADLQRTIEKYLMAGTIDQAEASMITDKIGNILSHPNLAGCFDEKAMIKNESEILEKNNSITSLQRPDRVVFNNNMLTIIDYKTGEKESKHIKQIEHYGQLFESLGYRNVFKKLVYIDPEIEVVDV